MNLISIGAFPSFFFQNADGVEDVVGAKATSIRLLLQRRCSLGIGEYGFEPYTLTRADSRAAIHQRPLHSANRRAAFAFFYQPFTSEFDLIELFIIIHFLLSLFTTAEVEFD